MTPDRLEFLRAHARRASHLTPTMALELVAYVDELSKQKDGAYSERNQCVALMARMALRIGWLAGTRRHPDLDVDWEDDWRTIVFINIPDIGQTSWHFHDSERGLLKGLPEYPTGWDGHDTPEKYRRVAAALNPEGRETT